MMGRFKRITPESIEVLFQRGDGRHGKTIITWPNAFYRIENVKASAGIDDYLRSLGAGVGIMPGLSAYYVTPKQLLELEVKVKEALTAG